MKYSSIVSKIPVPESLEIFRDLEKYEARSMHGQLPVVWDSAENCQVFDKYGNIWIDFTSTIFVANIGHAHPHVIERLQDVLDKKLLHTYTFANEYRAKFLKKLIETMPDKSLEKAFLMSSGTEATECAVKLMRMHGQQTCKSKIGIVSFRGSMHGRTMGAEMLGGNSEKAEWIGYKDPNIHHLPFPYPWIKSNFFNDISKMYMHEENIAGFMIESYQGWGAIFYPKEYIQDLVRYAHENHMLVCFDEIQSGFGRTGKLFAYQHYEVEPDLICVGKALSASLPLSAVIGRKEIMDIPEVGSMSSTHSGNPLCCAAGLANLEVFESENIVGKADRKGKILHQKLNELKDKYSDKITYILGKGMVAGIIFKDPKFATEVAERCMRTGLLVVHTGRESIKIGPPLIIPDEVLLEGISILDEAIQYESNQKYI